MRLTGKMSNCSIPADKTSVVVAISYSVVMLVGLPLNGLSLWIILKRHGLKSSNTVFMANLALSDFLLTLPLPLRIYYHSTAIWPFGDVVCTTSRMLFRVNTCTSAVFITFIGVDRLLAVEFPLRSRMLRTSRSSGIACAVTWVLFIVLNIPQAITGNKDMIDCSEKARLEWWGVAGSLTIFALLMVNVVSTAMVMRTLHRLKTESIRRNKGRVMMIFGVNLFMFAAFFVPYGMLLFLRSLCVIQYNLVVRMGTVCFVSFNICFDPLVYYFSLDDFWKKKAQHTLDT
ncbi:lysophosphatidic acid receptor 5b [Anguilla rostrata]|uniref:lysophosphatidic acid receptor 5b n=1 Tax=Anguilla rostrata TaxID=7938 RepID=UPI0030CA7385